MSEPAHRTYEFSGFRLDPVRRVLYGPHGSPIPLQPKVFDTLLYLVEHSGELLDKRTLLEAIWPSVVVEDNNLNQAISTLRRTLGEHPGEHRFIVTEPGRGYRFVAGVRLRSDDGAASGGKAAADAMNARPRPAARVLYVIAAVSIGIVLAALPWYSGHDDESVLPSSVAVLPLADLSPDASNAYLAVGMHIAIISQLTSLRGLNVIGRDAVLRIAADRPSYAEIASALNVQSILTGTFRYSDDEIRVSVELVDPDTGANVWAGEYESDFEDVFAVQSDIATNVAAALGAGLSPLERQRVEARPTASMDAYRAYWRAFGMGRAQALESLERAIALDPGFALAYARLAFLYARSPIDWISGPAVEIDASELEQRVKANARMALELDAGLALPHLALGELAMYSWQWRDAERDFMAAYERSPNDPTVLGTYSQFETNRGEYGHAVAIAERLLELDPPLRDLESTGTGSLYFLWLVHVYSGAIDAALGALSDHLSLHPRQTPARLNLGFIEARRGNRPEAARAFRIVEETLAELGAPSATAAANLAYGYSRIGHADAARRLFEKVVQQQAEGTTVDAGTWAAAYLAIGAHERALASLDRAIERIEQRQPASGWFSLMIIKHNLTGDPLLEEPRFRARRARIGGG